MAKHFIGQLILRLRAEGLGEADKVRQAMDGINRQAKSLASAPWGPQFQSQLNRLGASAQQIGALKESWHRLHESMARDNLSDALRKSHIAGWRVATLGHFAAVKAGAEDTHKSIKNLRSSLGLLAKPAMVGLGFYTGAYGVGMLGREALIAASNARRVQADAQFAGLSEGERGKIDLKAEQLATSLRLEKADVFEVLKEASLSMPSTDAALAVAESMARAQLVIDTMFGEGSGIAGLRAFNKAMDNIEKVTPQEYTYFLENFMRAQQVAGRDLDPEAYAQAIKYSRSGGKVYGDEFMAKWLPFLIAETGGSDAGTQIRAAFDQFIIGRASKSAVNRQKELGIRDESGQLIGGDQAFTTNPIKWVHDYLLPQLAKQGVDMQNETEVAKILGEITNNRLSSDLLSRITFSYDQYRRLVEDRMPQAAGLDAADDVQKLNPFAAYQGFKDSLKNLSAEVMPMQTIATGLNSVADAINAFKQKVANGDPTVAALAYGGGAAAASWTLWTAGRLVWGLATAGTNLNAAAFALDAAAARLGAAGVTGGVADAAGKKSTFGLPAWAGTTLAGLLLGAYAIEEGGKRVPLKKEDGNPGWEFVKWRERIWLSLSVTPRSSAPAARRTTRFRTASRR